jgi:hypothetical protein
MEIAHVEIPISNYLFHAKTPTRKFRHAKVTAASRIREKEIGELETAEFKTKE